MFQVSCFKYHLLAYHIDLMHNDGMWQCKYCKERFLEEDPDHVCVTDSLAGHFKGRKALLQPLFNAFLHKLQRIGAFTIESADSFIVLSSKSPFAIARVGVDHIDICLKMPESRPVAAALSSASRLRLPNMTHYFSLHSISDITPDIMRSLMWAKEGADSEN